MSVFVRFAGSRVQYFRLWMRMNDAPKFRNAFWLCLHSLVSSSGFLLFFFFFFFFIFLFSAFFGVVCGILDCRRRLLKLFLFFNVFLGLPAKV